MVELYWIERFDSIRGILIALSICLVAWLLLASVIPWIEEYGKAECQAKGFYKARKISSTLLAISVLIVIFLPSTKEMYRIIGIGGTIDYIRQNETAKQLPDKCVKALDLFMDKVLIEEDNSKKE